MKLKAKKTVTDIVSQIICFSRNGSSLTKEDIVTRPKNAIAITEENIIQSIFGLEKKEKIPELFLLLDSGSILLIR